MKAKKVASSIVFALLMILTVFFAFFAAITIKFRVKYTTTIVQQYSMVPTINKSLYLQNPFNTFEEKDIGDVAYVNKKSKIGLGDVVVADVKSENDPILKRVVGTPGDKIRITKTAVNGQTTYTLLVNEQPLYTKPEKQTIGKSSAGDDVVLNNSNSYNNYLNFLVSTQFLQNRVKPLTEPAENNPNCYIILHENEYFLMGDNWNNSRDSLSFGVVQKSEITGKVVYLVDYFSNQFWEAIKLTFKDFFYGTNKNNLAA